MGSAHLRTVACVVARNGVRAARATASRDPGHLDVAAQGYGIPIRDKVPALAQSVTADEIARTSSPNITDTLFQRIPGISVSDQQGNTFQTDIRYRGFAASPVPGMPQGIAVYMNGIRLNEAFGDTVNFDLIPTNAIARADVQSNNPVFGLNALGGAISLQMKNGFTYQGREAELQGGSFGRASNWRAAGAAGDDFAVYVAAQGLSEDGWRQHSPAQLARLYVDVGWRRDGNEIHRRIRGLELSLRCRRFDPDPSCCNAIGRRLYLAADDREPEPDDGAERQVHGRRELDAAGQRLCAQLPASAYRRQRRRRRALQRCLVVPE